MKTNTPCHTEDLPGLDFAMHGLYVASDEEMLNMIS